MGYLKFRTYLDRCRVCGSKTVLEDSEYPQGLRICTKCIMNEIPKIEEKEYDRIRELESSNDDLACDNDNLEGKK